MYNHRAERNRVDVVDLDPYGTAAPFIDAAVQCVNDGGMPMLRLVSCAANQYFTNRSVMCDLYRFVGIGDNELSGKMVCLFSATLRNRDLWAYRCQLLKLWWCAGKGGVLS